MRTARPLVLNAPDDRFLRRLVTPEGVPLNLRLATAGERAAALSIDLVILLGALAVAMLIVGGALAAAPGEETFEFALIVWLLFYFGLRNLYFLAFEAGRRAATPGKRILGLRVVTRDGGPLGFDAVFARNAMREVEVFLPAGVLLSGGADGVDGWIALAAALWCLVFVLLPLFNRDRLRAGDLLAGTWVVRTPRRRLLADLASGDAHAREHDFTPEQLAAYGVKELQVLEAVIRAGDAETTHKVAAQIRRKIGWRDVGAAGADLTFLTAYYTALRAELEARLLMGVRKADKHDGATGPGSG